MAKKKAMGFETPSMHIQEEYEEILEQIMAKKTDWEELLKRCNRVSELAATFALEIYKKTPPTETQAQHAYQMEIAHRTIALYVSLSLIMTARIGKELSECDARVATILKDLRKAAK